MKERERDLELRERDGDSSEGGKGGFGGAGHGVAGNDSVLRNRVGGAKEGQRLHAHETHSLAFVLKGSCHNKKFQIKIIICR